MKACTVCRSEVVNPYAGAPSRCGQCHRDEMKRLRRENPEKFSAREKARYLGARRQKILDDATARRWANPQKYAAHTAISNAVRDGRIPKSSTDDYEKPLDVVWFCVRCHRRHHADNPHLEK